MFYHMLEKATLIKFIARISGKTIDNSFIRLLDIWCTTPLKRNPQKKSLIKAAMICGVNNNNLELFNRDIKEFVNELAKIHPKIGEQAFFREIHRDGFGKLIFADWEDIIIHLKTEVKIVFQNLEEELKKKYLSPEIPSPPKDIKPLVDMSQTLGKNYTIFFLSYKDFILSTRRAPISIIGKWVGWSIYNLSDAYPLIGKYSVGQNIPFKCYLVNAEITERTKGVFGIIEKITLPSILDKRFNCLVPSENSKKTFTYIGSGKTYQDNNIVFIADKAHSGVLSVIHLVHDPATYMDGSDILKGVVTIKTQNGNNIGTAGIVLKRALKVEKNKTWEFLSETFQELNLKNALQTS